jgi:hypothetical protein
VYAERDQFGTLGYGNGVMASGAYSVTNYGYNVVRVKYSGKPYPGTVKGKMTEFTAIPAANSTGLVPEKNKRPCPRGALTIPQ